MKIEVIRNEKGLRKREKSAINIRHNQIKKGFESKDLLTNKLLL